MVSSQARVLQHIVSESPVETKEDLYSPTLTAKTLKALKVFRTELLENKNHIDWAHIDSKQTLQPFTLKELLQQFNLLEDILESKFAEEKEAKIGYTTKRDQFKIALEYYKLAIIEAVLKRLREEEPEPPPPTPSKWMHFFYYVLMAGGIWISYLHGYDAAKAIANLLPFSIPGGVLWGAGSFLFLVSLGLFSSFEASEMRKQMGFSSTKNLKTTLDINARQIEVTHQLGKYINIHSDSPTLQQANKYSSHVQLLKTFDRAINKTKDHVESFKESRTRKFIKHMLLGFGMAFSAADQVFLVMGFGALALTGPVGWGVIGLTALVGAVLFYLAFHDMVRDKVAPVLKQKQVILEKYEAYRSDELIRGAENHLAEKRRVEQLEAEFKASEDKISEMKRALAEAKGSVEKKNAEIKALKTKASIEVKPNCQRFKYFRPKPLNLKPSHVERTFYPRSL